MRTKLVITPKRQAIEVVNSPEKDRELISRTMLLGRIARGEQAIKEGRSLTHQQAKQRMSRWLK